MKCWVVCIQGDKAPGEWINIKSIHSVHFSEKAAQTAAERYNEDHSVHAACTWETTCVNLPAVLQAAGKEMARPQEYVIPGWDFSLKTSQNEQNRYRSVRQAAWAVMNSNNPCQTVTVNACDLAALVGFIGDYLDTIPK